MGHMEFCAETPEEESLLNIFSYKVRPRRLYGSVGILANPGTRTLTMLNNLVTTVATHLKNVGHDLPSIS